MNLTKLRRYTLNDLEKHNKWLLDLEVTKFLDVPKQPSVLSEEEIKAWIELDSLNLNKNYKQRAVVTKEGKQIGWIDLNNIDKTSMGAEIGVVIGDKDCWGKGYGASAVIEGLKWGFLSLNLNNIWLRVDFDHIRAIYLYKKIGFKKIEVLHEDRMRNEKLINRIKMNITKAEFLERNYTS